MVTHCGQGWLKIMVNKCLVAGFNSSEKYESSNHPSQILGKIKMLKNTKQYVVHSGGNPQPLPSLSIRTRTSIRSLWGSEPRNTEKPRWWWPLGAAWSVLWVVFSFVMNDGGLVVNDGEWWWVMMTNQPEKEMEPFEILICLIDWCLWCQYLHSFAVDWWSRSEATPLASTITTSGPWISSGLPHIWTGTLSSSEQVRQRFRVVQPLLVSNLVNPNDIVPQHLSFRTHFSFISTESTPMYLGVQLGFVPWDIVNIVKHRSRNRKRTPLQKRIEFWGETGTQESLNSSVNKNKQARHERALPRIGSA